MSSAPTDAGREAAAEPSPGTLGVLWVGVLLPAASWVVDLVARYMLVRFASAHRVRWPLRAATLACLGALLVGAVLCWRARAEGRRLLGAKARPAAPGAAAGAAPDETPGDWPGGGEHIRRAHTQITLSTWGLAMAAFFLLLILAQAYPSFVLDVQEIT
jgi:hypothetical protein